MRYIDVVYNYVILLQALISLRFFHKCVSSMALVLDGNGEESRSSMNRVISLRARPCPEIIGIIKS